MFSLLNKINFVFVCCVQTMPKPAVPPKYVNGKDMSDNSENEVGLVCCMVREWIYLGSIGSK